MKEEETPNTEAESKGGHVRRGRHARGGKAKEVNEYNAQGSPEVKEAEDEAEDFGKGGHTKRHKRAHGGHAEGEAAMHRADRMPRGRHAVGGATQALAKGGRAEREREHEREEHEREHDRRGGRTEHEHEREKRARGGRAMGGHSPYSSGRHLSGETGGGAADGHEGQKVPSESE